MDALRSDSPLIVYVDVKSPFAFVAIRPTFELEAELNIQIDWRPLTLDIPSFLGSATKRDGKVVESKGRSAKTWKNIRAFYADARRYAERQGYMLKGTEKIWDSSIANIGILWVAQRDRQKMRRYLDAVYPPFWRRELDIEDVSVVENCLQQAGIEHEGFADFQASEGRKLHDSLQAQFHPKGVFGVPTYVFEDKILWGREHLPYVRWYLSGRNGPPPDIAYEIS